MFSPGNLAAAQTRQPRLNLRNEGRSMMVGTLKRPECEKKLNWQPCNISKQLGGSWWEGV